MGQFSFPPSVLGEVAAITISTPELETSFAYYQKLGFSEVQRFDFPFPWIQVSDGTLLIMLRKDVQPYIALTYYVNDMAARVQDLESRGIQFSMKPGAGDMVPRALFQSRDGYNISLVANMDGFFKQPGGPGMLTMDPKELFNPENMPNASTGIFGEYAQPVRDLDTSIAFWENIGFKQLSRFTNPYPWAIISDGLSVVGLHQSTHFNQPTITYFAPDMGARISKLATNGLENFAFSGGSQSNAVLTTPEGQNVFLFSLGGK